MAVDAAFFSLQMGANSSRTTHLKYIFLKSWDKFDPQSLKKTHLIFFGGTECPQDPLEDGERWPVEGSLNYHTVLQLDLFGSVENKRSG